MKPVFICFVVCYSETTIDKILVENFGIANEKNKIFKNKFIKKLASIKTAS